MNSLDYKKKRASRRFEFSPMDRAIAELNTPYNVCVLAQAFASTRPGLSFADCCYVIGYVTSQMRTIEKDLDAIVIQNQREQAERAVAS